MRFQFSSFSFLSFSCFVILVVMVFFLYAICFHDFCFFSMEFFFFTRLKTNERNQISPSVTRTVPLPGKSGSREEPHAQLALCWRRLESTVSPATTWQTPSQQCIPTGCTNVSTKPRGLGPGGGGDDTTKPGTVVDRSALTETSGKP